MASSPPSSSSPHASSASSACRRYEHRLIQNLSLFALSSYPKLYTNLPSQVLFNLYGLLRFNAFPPDVRLRGSPLLAPLICVRVVTRGRYKALLRETVRKNLATLARAGVENFAFQVKNMSLNLPITV